ncbi:NAD(P)H:quinone oxidoreductase [Nocardioides perillae]|uniref:NAD(P)H dehydrogenase (Quinone) n=1 Tax=Nocardioides perillae TaxID=1119534 RepID=A0A7Y9UNK0_9ACTN|nr:NAD(P)H:quinone oxidoreductase [Nocardioides perillae]NYG56546.1 NAD(P)H dehydrogenase (quinone) [Nocardioides perillae]
MSVKLAIIYYSSTGNVDGMARHLQAAAEKAGAEVRLRHVEEIAPDAAIDSQPRWREHVEAIKDEPRATADDIVWADAVIFGTPTRYGNVASQLKQFIDTLGPQWAQGQLADKAYAGFTSSQTAHGGQESTLLALYNVVYHFGGIIVPPGYTEQLKFADGNPYGASLVSGGDNSGELSQVDLDSLDHLARRVVTVAGRLTGGN